MNQTTAIPAGCMQDAQGRYVPITMIKPIDKERNDLVYSIVQRAMALSVLLSEFKLAAMGDIEAFVDLSAEQYGVKRGGKKGNVELVSFDGQYKVLRAINESITFDERIQGAKELVRECIKEWGQGSKPEIMALINDAFAVDSQGRINAARLLALRRLNITDEKWQMAMKALSDAVQVSGSKAYVRIYKRQDDGSYKQINLDLAAL